MKRFFFVIILFFITVITVNAQWKLDITYNENTDKFDTVYHHNNGITIYQNKGINLPLYHYNKEDFEYDTYDSYEYIIFYKRDNTIVETKEITLYSDVDSVESNRNKLIELKKQCIIWLSNGKNTIRIIVKAPHKTKTVKYGSWTQVNRLNVTWGDFTITSFKEKI